MKQEFFPSVHDTPVITLANAIAASAKKLPPLGRITILIGNNMNVTHWPHSRSYISFSKSITGELIIGLAHHSEVKHIKQSFRHEMPASLGWNQPEIGNGYLIHSWHKKLISNAAVTYISKAFIDALDDCHLTYTQSELEHQNLFFLNEEVEYLSAPIKRIIDSGKSCSWLQPGVENLLREDDEVSLPEDVLTECDTSLPKDKHKNSKFWVVVNHRGHVTDLIQEVRNGKGDLWFGERDGVAIPIKKPKCGLLPIQPEVASRLWSGDKVKRLQNVREEL